MIVDSSALVAILLLEDDYRAFFDIITSTEAAFISAATLAEASIVLIGRTNRPGICLDLDQLISENRIAIEPVTAEDARAAREAFRVYGKGRHRAALNFGDCFTYALASRLWQPILCKGSDFAQTDALVVPLAS